MRWVLPAQGTRLSASLGEGGEEGSRTEPKGPTETGGPGAGADRLPA